MALKKIIPQTFYLRHSKIVAKELLGKILFHKTKFGELSGIIVETESYGGCDDPASHAYKNPTPRNSAMFKEGGYAYVYLCYGFHHLFNIVTEKKGIPSAVLLRAIEPVEGIHIMKKLCNKNKTTELTNGPGKLTKAFMINKTYNKKPVFKNNLLILDTNKSQYTIIKKPRIGIKVGTEALLRFYIKDNNFVSQK